MTQLDLPSLGKLAQEFDEISRDDGQYWPAARFVEWLDYGQSAADLTQRMQIEASVERLAEARSRQR